MHDAYDAGGNRKMSKYIATAAALSICAALMLPVVCISAAADRSVIVTEAHDGKTIAIGKGQSLVISLESNPSTGYVWQVGKNDNAILELVGQPAFHPAAPQMPGASGRQL